MNWPRSKRPPPPRPAARTTNASPRAGRGDQAPTPDTPSGAGSERSKRSARPAAERSNGQGQPISAMMRGQARSSLTIKGVDNLMIAETVPVHVTTPRRTQREPDSQTETSTTPEPWVRGRSRAGRLRRHRTSIAVTVIVTAVSIGARSDSPSIIWWLPCVARRGRYRMTSGYLRGRGRRSHGSHSRCHADRR